VINIRALVSGLPDTVMAVLCVGVHGRGHTFTTRSLGRERSAGKPELPGTRVLAAALRL
jgi:hypothetical protein